MGIQFPRQDVERRYRRRFEDLARILPYCDEAVFFDNDNGFFEVAEYRNGELILKGSKLPDWVRELSDTLP